MIAEVVINSTAQAADRLYSYIIEPEIKELVKTGVRVKVPFGASNKLYEAYVVSVKESSDHTNLKSISQIVEDYSYFNEDTVKLIEFMRNRYFCTYISAIKAIVPTGVKKSWEYQYSLAELDEKTIEEQVQNSVTETAICNFLKSNPKSTMAQIGEGTGKRNIYTQLKNLEIKGVIIKLAEAKDGIRDNTQTFVHLCCDRAEAFSYIDTTLSRSPAQANVLEIMCGEDRIALPELLEIAGTSKATVDNLVKKGYLQYSKETVFDTLSQKAIEIVPSQKPDLTEAQLRVVDEVLKSINSDEYNVYLLHGVTGSGKTEVYLNLIDDVIKRGKQAIFLVPEIALTPQMVAQVMSRFGTDVAVLHSNLTIRQRYDEWKNIKNNNIKVVVGARSAIFAPLENLGLIIIDEEHENTYKSEFSPRYSTSEVARFLAKQKNATVLLASATPSVESYYMAKQGKYKLLNMPDRIGEAQLPDVKIVDMRQEMENGNMSIFSEALQAEIRKNIDDKKQTILFMNKRGFSSFVSCRSCGYVIECPNCNISLTYHKSVNKMVCHYCDYMQAVPKMCPSCESRYIKYFGTGTQRVQEEAQKLFPDASFLRMDADTTSHRMGHEEILNKFKSEKTDILIGTQMITKGLNIENVTLVGVLAADMSLNMADWHAQERTFDLITQVSGRAGRGRWRGRSIIQTYNPDDETIISSSNQDYISFYDNEIEFRKNLIYPPFCEFINIVFSHMYYKTAKMSAEKFYKDLLDEVNKNKLNSHIMIYKPAEAPMVRISNKYRYRILLKTRYSHRLYEALHKLYDKHSRDRKSAGIVIDVNPQNMY